MAKLPDVLSAPPIELRRWRPDDLDALLAALEASRDELQQWMPWATPWPSAEQERAVLAAGHANFEADGEYSYSMFDGDEVVGGAVLTPVADEGTWQIGYWTRSDRTSRGYATASARALTTAAFELLRLESLQLRMDQANAASAAVPPKLGYVLTASPDRDVLAPAQSGRGFVWTMTRDRWRRTSA